MTHGASTTILVLSLLILGGCSGGGDEAQLQQALNPPGETPPTQPPTQPPPSPPPTEPPAEPTPAGVWHGQTNREGREVTGVVLPDGRTWFVTSSVGAPDWAGGVITGTLATEGSTWTMTNGLEVDVVYQTRVALQASGTFLYRQRFLANLKRLYDPPSTGPPLYETDGLDLIYDTRSERAFRLDEVAGEYLGLLLPLQEAEITVENDGKVSGMTAFGCTFAGQVTPEGPVGLVTLTFDGPPCQQDHATVKGMLTVDQGGRLVSAALSSDRNQVFVLTARKER